MHVGAHNLLINASSSNLQESMLDGFLFKSNHELELNSYKVTIIVTIELNVNSIHYSKAVEKPIFVLNQTTRYSELAQAME
ncbi:hypothetical protein DERP_009538 [Dermatophagoides pteronyssinus]|uniref:Uncharacterized protein n=1 Tax=Dermatophagoides pteronyssinus TaxID=6956 RepID=A0ABQ8IUF2_DERPT|nr:hypothetical protein DERP_009538 [Dermatophagoides pteronyssinus]